MRYLAFLLIFLFVSCGPSSPVLSTSTVTHTKTPTLTPTHTIIPTSTIPTNPGYFEDVGEIVETEKHEGKWYGIDTLGRAEIVLNDAGEWEKYDRPIFLAYNDSLKNLLTPTCLVDLNQNNITRLTGGVVTIPFVQPDKPFDQAELMTVRDDQLPWGVILEEYTPSNMYMHAYLSGYPIGTLIAHLEAEDVKLTLFEIPLRYMSQVVMMALSDQSDIFAEIFAIPESGNIQDMTWNSVSNHQFVESLTSAEAIGKQMVIAIQIDDPTGSGSPLAQFIKNLESGIGTNITNSVFRPSRAIIPKSLLP